MSCVGVAPSFAPSKALDNINPSLKFRGRESIYCFCGIGNSVPCCAQCPDLIRGAGNNGLAIVSDKDIDDCGRLIWLVAIFRRIDFLTNLLLRALLQVL